MRKKLVSELLVKVGVGQGVARCCCLVVCRLNSLAVDGVFPADDQLGPVLRDRVTASPVLRGLSHGRTCRTRLGGIRHGTLRVPGARSRFTDDEPCRL